MTERPAGDFGRMLREARERRGVSLREIANATKISVRALEALERNDIKGLPGGIFTRAFVRSFAVQVGLDPEAAVREFIDQFPHDSVTAGHPTSRPIEDGEALESGRRTATTFGRLALISIPLAGALVYFGISGRPTIPLGSTSKSNHEIAQAPPPPPSAATGPVSQIAAPASASTIASESPAASSGSSPVATVPPDRLIVRVSATRNCWVSATADGARAIQRLMRPGEQATIEVRRELLMTTGDAAALVITLNGAEARPLGRSGEVVTTRLDLTNYRGYLANP